MTFGITEKGRETVPFLFFKNILKNVPKNGTMKAEEKMLLDQKMFLKTKRYKISGIAACVVELMKSKEIAL